MIIVYIYIYIFVYLIVVLFDLYRFVILDCRLIHDTEILENITTIKRGIIVVIKMRKFADHYMFIYIYIYS